MLAQNTLQHSAEPLPISESHAKFLEGRRAYLDRREQVKAGYAPTWGHEVVGIRRSCMVGHSWSKEYRRESI